MRAETQTLAQLVDNHVFLVGRPPVGEFLAFIKSQAVDSSAVDDRSLANDWRAANDHITAIEQQEIGLADNAAIGDVPESLGRLCEQLIADPIYQASFQVVPCQIGIVELDRLVVFQKQINLGFVEELKSQLGSRPSEEDIFRFCLPFHHPTPPVNGMRISQNSFAFVSPSTDLRVLDLEILDPTALASYTPSGPMSGVVALVVGFGSNFLNAVGAEGRLVLNNGSHRAYALRELGITHAPCIVQRVSRREELELFPQINANPDLYLRSARPPLLKDYFDERLRKIVRVPRKLRQIRAVVQFEQVDMPAV